MRVNTDYIKQLVLDLRESGHIATAQDFMQCVSEIEELRLEVDKLREKVTYYTGNRE